MLLLVVFALVVVLVSVLVGVEVGGLVALVVPAVVGADGGWSAGPEAVGTEGRGHGEAGRGERYDAEAVDVEADAAHAPEEVGAHAPRAVVVPVAVVVAARPGARAHAGAAAAVLVVVVADLVDGHGALGAGRLARHPAVGPQLYHVPQHEANAQRQLAALGQPAHALEVLLHKLGALVGVEDAAAGAHDLAEALDVLGGVPPGSATPLIQ